MDTVRWDSGGASLWEWEHGNTTRLRKRKKKSLPKKIQKFLSNKTRGKSLTTKKKICPNLIISRLFSFYFGERDRYSRTWYFLSVRTNLFASKIHFKGINSNRKSYGYRAGSIDPLATSSNTTLTCLLPWNEKVNMRFLDKWVGYSGPMSL